MKKVVVLVLSFGLIGSAMGQIAYPTNVFWQFLEGLQAGDSSTLNYLEYKNDFLLLKTDQRDDKVLQVRNELNDIGISTIFIDANGNGGFSIDSSGGQTVIKLRGALSDHSYINNEFVSIGRGGQSQDYGGNVDGAKFTVSSDTREPDYGLWDANNYQMMLQSAKDSLGGYVGLAFTSESAAQDRNVGAFINYRKTGNNGRGVLHFGTKTATGSLADGVHAMKIYDGSVTIDSTIVLPNLATGTSDTVLILDGDVVQKKDISSFADNIYNTDGTLTGNRTLNLDTYDLTFNGGDVGIGTTSPIVGLDVRGTAIITNQAGTEYNENLRLPEAISGFASMTLGGSIAASGTSGTSQWTILKYPTSNLFSIRNNHTDRLNITTGGNVGIATTTPSSRLQVKGNGSTSATTAFLVENSNASPSLSVLDNGNVGIGTTSPAHKLDIAGGAFADYYQLDTTATPTPAQGMMFWKSDDSSANLQVDADLALKIGQDNTWYVKNQTGATITKGTAVMSIGTLGASGRITVAPMVANGTVSAKYLLGIAAEDIANGADGFVMNIGKIKALDASAFTDGDVLYCSPTTPGALTATVPTAPNLKLPVAFVVHASANGTIAVRVNPGNDLHEDNKVEVSSVSTGQLLRWNINRWENWTPNFLNQTILSGIWSDFLSASTTESAPIISGNWQSPGNRGRVQYVSPASGTISDIYIKTNSIQPATGSLLFELYVNDIIQLTITVPAGSAAGTFSNTVDSVSISTGDLIHYYIVNNATSNSAFVSGGSMIFTYD